MSAAARGRRACDEGWREQLPSKYEAYARLGQARLGLVAGDRESAPTSDNKFAPTFHHRLRRIEGRRSRNSAATANPAPTPYLLRVANGPGLNSETGFGALWERWARVVRKAQVGKKNDHCRRFFEVSPTPAGQVEGRAFLSPWISGGRAGGVGRGGRATGTAGRRTPFGRTPEGRPARFRGATLDVEQRSRGPVAGQ